MTTTIKNQLNHSHRTTVVHPSGGTTSYPKYHDVLKGNEHLRSLIFDLVDRETWRTLWIGHDQGTTDTLEYEQALFAAHEVTLMDPIVIEAFAMEEARRQYLIEEYACGLG